MNVTTRIGKWWHFLWRLWNNPGFFHKLIHPLSHALQFNSATAKRRAFPSVVSAAVEQCTRLQAAGYEVGVIHNYHGSSEGLIFYDSHSVTTDEK